MKLKQLASRHADDAGVDAETAKIILELSEFVESNPKQLQKDWPFNEEILDFLFVVEKNRPDISASLWQLFSWKAQHSLELGDVSEAERYYLYVIKGRRDPNIRNNELRYQLAVVASGKEAKEFAKGRILELSASNVLSFPQSFRLFFLGYFGRFWPILLIVSAVVLLLISVCTGSSRISALLSGGNKQPPKERLDEYSRLLKLFDLDDQATEADIKKAFRDKAKAYHPDQAGDSDPDGVEKFVELKKAHQKLIRMRAARFR